MAAFEAEASGPRARAQSRSWTSERADDHELPGQGPPKVRDLARRLAGGLARGPGGSSGRDPPPAAPRRTREALRAPSRGVRPSRPRTGGGSPPAKPDRPREGARRAAAAAARAPLSAQPE